MAAKPEYGGYDYKYVDEVPERFVCIICTKVLREPHITSCCGQHFCESCLENWFKKQGKKSCPHCRKYLQHFLNKERERDINHLRIHCTHHEEGCQWVGELGSIRTHLDSENGCGYVEVDCTNKCRSLAGVRKMKRKALQEHLRNECYLRKYRCEHCGHVDTYENITGATSVGMKRAKTHYDECPEYPLRCPNGCGVGQIKRRNMSGHRRTECPLETVECPNKCRTHHASQEFAKIKRKDLQEHLDSDCPFRKYKCEHCGYVSTYTAITGCYGTLNLGKSHYDECPEYPLECPNRCGTVAIKRKDMSAHCESVCQLETVECPNKCNTNLKSFTKLLRKHLQEHLSRGCPLRKYKCQYCACKSTYKAITGKCYGSYVRYESHYDECPEYPLECPNECGAETMKRKDMSAHRDECPDELVECPNECICSRTGSMKRKDLPVHLRNECYLRRYHCEHCGLEDTFEKITGTRDGERQEGASHYDICPEYPLECPNKCGEDPIKRKDMSTHRDECPEEPMECPFKEAGCETKLVRRDLDDHVKTQTQQHLLVTTLSLSRKCNAVEAESSSLRRQYDELKTRCDTLEVVSNTLRSRCDTLEAESNVLRKVVSFNVDRLLSTCTDEQRLPLQSLQAVLTPTRHHLKTQGHSFTINIKPTRKVSYSPPFYFREGYKLCLALHPKKGVRTHMHVSLSLLLIRGEFDDELEWPIQSSGYHLKIALWSEKNEQPKQMLKSGQIPPPSQATVTGISVCYKCAIPDRLMHLPLDEDTRVIGNRDTCVEHETLAVQSNSIFLSVVLMRHYCPFCTGSLR